MHRYFYANANPARYVDPTGHQSAPANPVDEGQQLLDAARQELEDFSRANPQLDSTRPTRRPGETPSGAPRAEVVTEEDSDSWWRRGWKAVGQGFDYLGEKVDQAGDAVTAWFKKKWRTDEAATAERDERTKLLEGTPGLSDTDRRLIAGDLKPIQEGLAEHAGYATKQALEQQGLPAAAGGVRAVVRGTRAATAARRTAQTVNASDKVDELVPPLQRILYRMEDAPSVPLSGSRQAAIDRAWAQEVQLIQRTGRGTRPWSVNEIERIRTGASYKDLGYTGHHINRVVDAPAWKGDPRNIEFLRQGAGQEHMKLGHPGGTRVVQPSGYLIDRTAMLRSCGGGVVDCPR